VLLGAAPAARCIAYDLPAGGADGARLGSYTTPISLTICSPCSTTSACARLRLRAHRSSTVALAALAARPERLPRAILQSGFA
jgi:hypothetical protein